MTRSLRFRGALASLSTDDLRALMERIPATDSTVAGDTTRIIAAVRETGDAALIDQARRFDGIVLDALEVSSSVCQRALDALERPLRLTLERSARNISTVQTAFRPVALEVETELGVVVGRRPDPLDRVGVYAPGGRASYPSSVLMGAIPARVAGVGEVVLCTPAGPSGRPAPIVLAAAALVGIDRVFVAGGAGAIAAMAFGTASIPRVDRIVGPGNAYVNEAKRQLAHVVATDSPAGPSELLVIADASSDAKGVALEMIAQAEHDPQACAVAVVVGDASAESIERELIQCAQAADRREIVAQALAGQGGVLRARSMSAAVAFAEAYAPEHLWLAIESAESVLPQVGRAGAVFVGATSGVAFGDYLTGGNHVLPTGGTARAWSGLSVLDCVRWTSYQRVDRAAAARLAADTACFAESESLPGHAAAARRFAAAPGVRPTEGACA